MTRRSDGNRLLEPLQSASVLAAAVIAVEGDVAAAGTSSSSKDARRAFLEFQTTALSHESDELLTRRTVGHRDQNLGPGGSTQLCL